VHKKENSKPEIALFTFARGNTSSWPARLEYVYSASRPCHVTKVVETNVVRGRSGCVVLMLLMIKFDRFR
jgi:hypothetical protein